MQDLLFFALEHFAYRDTCPFAHDLGDHLFVYRIFKQRTLLLHSLPLLVELLELLLQLWDLAIFDLGRFVVFALSLRLFGFGFEAFDLLFDLGDLFEDLLLCLELRFESAFLFFEFGQLFFYLFEALFVFLVFLHQKRLFFDQELLDLSFDFGQLERLGLDLHLQLRRRFVDEVDSLVRQIPIGDVAA